MGMRPDAPDDGALQEFLRSAVIDYSQDDGPQRHERAARILAAFPDLPRRSIHAAAAAADPAAVAAHLADDPASARRPGGPLGWEPLLFLTYSRLPPAPRAEDAVSCLELLLRAGADPDAGFLLPGTPTPFTALTGVFGDGETGEHDRPPHPHQYLLAALLLERGADPNDAQALYNRMFGPADDHLALLLAHGLGAGSGGPWHERSPGTTDDPAQLVRGQLGWAVTHGRIARISMLAGAGIDLEAPLDAGTLPMSTRLTPMELALVAGQQGVVAELTRLGVRPGSPDPVIELVGALMNGETDRVAALSALSAAAPPILEGARRRFPSLVLRAAVVDRWDAVELLLRNGFDIDAKGRADIVAQQPWETALHWAAGEGRFELARRLLAHGADPDLLDLRFGATPLGWATFFGHADLMALLRPVTAR